jgi:hypothetical protein
MLQPLILLQKFSKSSETKILATSNIHLQNLLTGFLSNLSIFPSLPAFPTFDPLHKLKYLSAVGEKNAAKTHTK